MKLWDKGISTNKQIEEYTVGNDRTMDLYLAGHDVLGTIAHITMLTTIGLITEEELPLLKRELIKIYREIERGNFGIEPGVEDVHSQVEYLLTQRLGDMGKKVHSGRSRNDQVLVDLRLFTRDELLGLISEVKALFTLLQELSEANKEILMPGYTHLQVAMPSSFGLWFGAYAEALTDDLMLLHSAYTINNQNPLGSAAGYGSSFPLNRAYTTELLGFDNLSYNAVYAQMGRGKVERIVTMALANLTATIGKMADDVCLFMSQNFGFVSLPDEFTTGSSIMPHKKNPDLFEITRAKCNRLQTLPMEIGMITGNMTTGYFRDYQLIKELYLPAFEEVKSILQMMQLAMSHLRVNPAILSDSKYNNIFTVEEVNRMVQQGIPFRDAYKKVAEMVQQGNFNPTKAVKHTHEGSIGNLCNQQIAAKFNGIYNNFNIEKIAQAKAALLTETTHHP